MEQPTGDKAVPAQIQTLHTAERVILRETERAVTPFGGVAVFIAYLRKIDLAGKIRTHMPVRWRSPNQFDPTEMFTSFLIAVLAGAKRFAHANWLRGDRALHALLGLDRFPCDDTIRNLFRRFSMGNVERLFAPLTEWQMQRVPVRAEGYSLDLDSTVLERYGRQEGALKGHNPRKHGRPSQHRLLAVLSEAHFILHGSPPQRQLRLQPGSGRVSRRSLGALGTASDDPSGQSRFRFLRRQTAELPRTALSALHCSHPSDQVGPTRGATNSALDRTGRQLRRGRVSPPTARLEHRAAIRGDPRAHPGQPRQPGPQADRGAGLHLPDLRHQSRRSSGTDLARLQSARRYREQDRRTQARLERRPLLPETIPCHRGRLPIGAVAVQPAQPGSNAPPACQAIANRPPSALKSSLVERFWDARHAASCCPWARAGAA